MAELSSNAGRVHGTPPAERAPRAVADLYHAYFTGLILTLVSRRGSHDAARWMHAVFRHQNHEKFL
jgi:hypothetical protein